MSKVTIKRSDKYTDRAKQRLDDFLYEQTKVFQDVESDLALAPTEVIREFRDIRRDMARPFIRLRNLRDNL